MISACLVPSRPAAPVITATRPERSKSACARLVASLLVTSSLSAIGRETRSRNKSGGIRTEENRKVGYLFRRAKTRKRHARFDHLRDLIFVVFEVTFPGSACEKNISGRDSIDAHAELGYLVCQILRIIY